jgi:hypothetical protein
MITEIFKLVLAISCTVYCTQLDFIFQKCRNQAEAFSAAYLISKEYFINRKLVYNQTRTNVEYSTFSMLSSNFEMKSKFKFKGTAIQSVDIFDFSVIHLSMYERLQRRWFPLKKFTTDYLQPIIDSTIMLKQIAIYQNEQMNSYYKNTILLIPFLGVMKGTGNSGIENRSIYLQACFWSFYKYYKYILLVVTNNDDANLVRLLLLV